MTAGSLAPSLSRRIAATECDRLGSPGVCAGNVDVIVTAGTPATFAVKKATSTVPVVMAAVGDPVGTGIVPNLARPGGNITGMSAIRAGP